MPRHHLGTQVLPPLHHHLHLPAFAAATSPPPPPPPPPPRPRDGHITTSSIHLPAFKTATSPPPAPPAPCLQNGHVTTTSTSRPRHGHVTTIITSTFATTTSSRPTFNAAITTRDISSGISSRAGSFSLPQGNFFVFLFIYLFQPFILQVRVLLDMSRRDRAPLFQVNSPITYFLIPECGGPLVIVIVIILY
jgi:hypothetical protein